MRSGEWKPVAPLAGAWIEIHNCMLSAFANTVAPLAGAWIEIHTGLVYQMSGGVAPLAGAWIEITGCFSKCI